MCDKIIKTEKETTLKKETSVVETTNIQPIVEISTRFTRNANTKSAPNPAEILNMRNAKIQSVNSNIKTQSNNKAELITKASENNIGE